MGDGDDDALYNLCQRKKQKQKPKRRISQDLLSIFLNKEDISVWRPYDCFNFYILSVIIQWVLDEIVFGRENSVGITEDQIRILKDVSRGMWHARSKLGTHVLLGQSSDRVVAEQEKLTYGDLRQ